ncbi:MAG: methylmalonyl Co-A mutase-associated GTPase MeaB [Acidimicrobiia bacterium]|nr:methylmalonyl Co-A mutase-associated GTPase MeaB [Acidimicrobiia bacterium]
MKRDSVTPADLLQLAMSGNRHAVGRLLSLVEKGGAIADEVATVTHPLTSDARIIGITGPPGSGKSTLVSQLLKVITRAGLKPAVIAVDPSSPLTGGAILGDRVRIDATDTGAFIRSIATRGHSGGLALGVPGGVRVLDAVGFDPIIIETVGVGQVEVDVTATADTTIVVANPGTGDSVQANKAGLLEVADIFVVNKSDLAGADDARRDLELMLDLSHMTGQEDPTGRRPPIVMANSLDGSGSIELWSTIVDHGNHLVSTGQIEGRRAARARAELHSRAADRLLAALDRAIDSASGQAIVDALQNKDISPSEASDQLMQPILRED